MDWPSKDRTYQQKQIFLVRKVILEMIIIISYRFVYFRVTEKQGQKERWREGERVRERTLYLLVYSPNGCKGQGSTRLTQHPGLFWVSHVGGRNPHTWAIMYRFSQVISRESCIRNEADRMWTGAHLWHQCYRLGFTHHSTMLVPAVMNNDEPLCRRCNGSCLSSLNQCCKVSVVISNLRK